jgi:hypothetical protein
MNIIPLKTGFCLVIMAVFLIMAIITKNAINSQLFASLGIIIGILTLKKQ